MAKDKPKATKKKKIAAPDQDARLLRQTAREVEEKGEKQAKDKLKEN